jgi:hypothetical protein
VEAQHRDPHGIRRHHTLPSMCGRVNRALVKILHRCHEQHPHFSPVKLQLNRPHQIHTDHQCTEGHSCVDQEGHTPHQQGGDRNPLDLLGSGHDDVHGQLPILPHVMIGCWLSIALLQYIGKQVAVLSQSLIDLRAVMSLALPARRCYQSCKSTNTLHKD